MDSKLSNQEVCVALPWACRAPDAPPLAVRKAAAQGSGSHPSLGRPAALAPLMKSISWGTTPTRPDGGAPQGAAVQIHITIAHGTQVSYMHVAVALQSAAAHHAVLGMADRCRAAVLLARCCVIPCQVGAEARLAAASV